MVNSTFECHRSFASSILSWRSAVTATLMAVLVTWTSAIHAIEAIFPNAPPTVKQRPGSLPVRGFGTCPLTPEDFTLLSEIEQGKVVPNTQQGTSEGSISLSIAEMNQWSQTLNALEFSFMPLVRNQKSPWPVFVFVFDGTWNDRDEEGNPITVPGQLSLDLEYLKSQASGFELRYYHGVGTRVSVLGKLWEGMTGAGTKERAEEALHDLNEFIQREGKVPHIYVIGFSRGAASARHFLNLADPVLASSPGDNASVTKRSHSFALLFDTVATGQQSSLQLAIPPSTISTIHFVATRERRFSFPVVTLQQSGDKQHRGQRLLELELPGAHSDLGGGYGNGLEALTLAVSRELLIRQGFPIATSSVRQQHILNTGRHNSDWIGTAFLSTLRKLGNQSDRESVQPNAIVEEKTVPTAEELVLSAMEEARLTIDAARAEDERVMEVKQRGQMYPLDSLSIQIQNEGEGLQLATNCPESVAFDIQARKLMFSDQPYIEVSDHSLREAHEGRGFILIVEPQNPADFH